MHRLNPGRYVALLYLLASAPAFFSYMYVYPSLVVYADAPATGRNILGSETLFRLGIAAELISSIGFIFLVFSLYRLFRNVDRTKAIVMCLLVLVSVPVSLLNCASLVAVLRLLKGGASLAAMQTSQLQALAMLFVRLHDAGIFIAQIFWGLWLLPLGLLVRRSGFVPPILGTLLIVNGLAYPIVTLIWLLTPSYAGLATRLALFPQLGEAWFILWLLIKGIPAQVTDDSPPATEPQRASATPQLAGAMLIAIVSLCVSAGAQTNDAQALAKYHVQLGDSYETKALSAGTFARISLIAKAKAEWEHAVEIDPNCIAARRSLIEFYVLAPALMGGSESEAKKQAGEIAKRDAIEGHRAFARIYTAINRPDLARNEYAEMLKTDGRSARARYWHGVYLMLTEKKYSAANAEFESALQLDPVYMPAYFQIGHVAALSGQSLAHGEASLKRYLTYQPKDDEPAIARAHYWLGSIYEMQHRKAEAQARYAASLTMNPNQKDVEAARKRVSK